MTIEITEGGWYFIHVDQDTLSIYVRLIPNDVIGTDDENPYTFYKYSRKNRLLQSGDTEYTYDQNGNMVEGETHYDYQSTFLDGYKVNHLASVGTWSGGGGGGDEENSVGGGETLNAVEPEETAEEIPLTIYSFALDGRRVGKAGFVNMTYLYDGENVVYELWDDKTVRFVHPVASGGGCSGCSGGCAGNGAGAFTDHPISITIDGIKYYYLYDGLGSVTELIDANENVVNQYRYTPFGEALIRQETVYNPYQFTGRQYDAESGLYHYRARAYSPDVGRFMQQDPAGMIDGTNMFVYCGNDPVNGRDPSGKRICQGVYLFCSKPVQMKPKLTTKFWDCMRSAGTITGWTIAVIISCVLVCYFNPACAVGCAETLGSSTAGAIGACLVTPGAIKWDYVCLWWKWGVINYLC